ncbi:hypothetical protein [Mesorhizobium zhangyense]|uniref:hypothetical protein n=1 Tax=Mesorhizobium zhangyense TaxID=1776730 RepID=UPI001FE2F555|nr:hypothetical protein [Mesorhizobium zhangyense]
MLVTGAVDVTGLVVPPAEPEEMASVIDATGAAGDKASTTPDPASLDTREMVLGDRPVDRTDVVPMVQDGNGASAAGAPEDPD